MLLQQDPDTFIIGEISEPQAHYARELVVAFIACGHHVSERYGATAVTDHVEDQLGLVQEFIEMDNPAQKAKGAPVPWVECPAFTVGASPNRPQC